MTLDDLTVNCQHLDRHTLLSDWHWLIGTTRLPVLVTLAGDAFVQDMDTGEVFFLDTVEGQLEQVAESGGDFQALLGNKDFVVRHFSVGLVVSFLNMNSRPPFGTVLSFKKPPVLGGMFDAKNLEATDVAVHFSVAGQIWKQARVLPPGTPIGKIEIS